MHAIKRKAQHSAARSTALRTATQRSKTRHRAEHTLNGQQHRSPAPQTQKHLNANEEMCQVELYFVSQLEPNARALVDQ